MSGEPVQEIKPLFWRYSIEIDVEVTHLVLLFDAIDRVGSDHVTAERRVVLVADNL